MTIHDRHYFVARWTFHGFEFAPMDSCTWDMSRVHGTVRSDEIFPGDGVKVEVKVIDVPTGITPEELGHDLKFDLHEWFFNTYRRD